MRTAILAASALMLLGAATPPSLAVAGGPMALTGAQSAATPDPDALNGICGDIRTGNSTRYERRVNEAANILPTDSATEIRAKASAMFAAVQPTCSGFNVRGSLLKYAVAARTYDFLYSAANVWDVDLNQIDASDGRTVIDYLDNEISKNLGRPAESELQSYRDMLVRAGARTTAHLQAGEDCRPSTRCRR